MKRAVFLLLILSWHGIAFAQSPPLVLNTIYTSPITSPDKSGFLDLLYAELFARLGIAFEIQALPAERALQNANAGIDDGDVCRIADLVNTYTNLVRTSEPVMQYRMIVFSREKNFPVAGPESLLPYEVGIVTGWKILERATQQHPLRMMVDSIEQLFRMLDQHRIEIAVIEGNKGRIDVYSEVGQGSVFKVYLPLAGGSGKEAARSEESEEVLPLGKERILVVDDEEQIVRMTTRMLEVARPGNRYDLA